MGALEEAARVQRGCSLVIARDDRSLEVLDIGAENQRVDTDARWAFFEHLTAHRPTACVDALPEQTACAFLGTISPDAAGEAVPAQSICTGHRESRENSQLAPLDGVDARSIVVPPEQKAAQQYQSESSHDDSR
ncbi:MAG: hypothetical protein ABI889_05015 [Gemmatimonadota bacterium]